MRKAISVAGYTLVIVALSACGGKYDKPLEVERTPRTGAYNYAGEYHGFEGAVSMGVTGGNLYVAYRDAGEVVRYTSRGNPVRDVMFNGVNQPFLVGVGRREIAVADLEPSLAVKIYSLSGGDPLLTFGDPDWEMLGGLAIDDSGNVYVADTERNFVRSYDSKGKPRFTVDLADSGFGVGHVLSPHGIFLDDLGLLISEADPEKAQVQRISIDEPQTAIWFSEQTPFITSFIDTVGNELNFMEPIDVSSDNDGHIFVLDRQLSKIMRFTADGGPDAIVNTIGAGGPDTLANPVAIGTYGKKIYCLDAGTGIVHRWDAQ